MPGPPFMGEAEAAASEVVAAAAVTDPVLEDAPAEESSTVVSDSLILSDSEVALGCQRAEGKVCICAACESTRTRMLHRMRNVNKRTRGIDAETTESSILTPPAAGTLTEHVDILEPLRKKPASTKDSEASFDDISEEINTSAPCDNNETRLATMVDSCKTILRCLGEDPNREGLIKTPERWAKALLFMCSGYQKEPKDVTQGAVFSENHDEMVVVRDIDIHSLCEHHIVPFTGRVHIGYIPNGKILGLSKLARIAELYARRLQVQERLTRQIADAIVETVQPLGVAVVVECTHFCMVMRGVQKTGAITTTSSVRGCFESNSKTRAEFFSIIQAGRAKMC